MKKKIFSLLLFAVLAAMSVSAQMTRIPNRTPPKVITQRPATTSQQQPAPSDPAVNNNPAAQVVPTTPSTPATPAAQDLNEEFEVAGKLGTTFTAANNYDGTSASYKQLLQISILLALLNSTTNKSVELIFYSPSQDIAEAVINLPGLMSIHYPISMYQDIKEKLDKALTEKKKIYIYISKAASGYREGNIVFQE